MVGAAWGHTAERKFYVSPKGKDNASGSKTSPWKTIQKAVNTVTPGSTIYIREGTYNEKVSIEVSGKEGKWIELRAQPGEKVVISGEGLKVKDTEALINIRNQNYIRIKGLEIQGLNADQKGVVPIGVFINGWGDHIELIDLDIHHIETRFTGKNGGDAHGLAVYGDDGTKPIRNILIDGVTIRNCRLGSSESMVLNGNVQDFVVRNCVVHDNNNIGIDFIGHEKVCPNPGLDQARNGVCRNNRVYNISSKGNPAYGKDLAAGGIYVDGGYDILIECNTVFDCDIGIEIASEHKGKSTHDIIVRNNLIVSSYQSGIMMGGYAANKGSAEKVSVIGNTLVHNDKAKWEQGEICFQHHVKDCVIINNIIRPLDQWGKGICIGGKEGENVRIDYNLYDNSTAPNLIWKLLMKQKQETKKKQKIEFDKWQELGHDKHGLVANPQFEDVASRKFSLKSSSPAVNRGTDETETGDKDLSGNPRKKGTHIDIGAFECK